jgi:phenylalanine-4-hydroxylase
LNNNTPARRRASSGSNKPGSDYTPEQHAIWASFSHPPPYAPASRQHACREYLDGFHQIGLREDKLPNLSEVSALLQPRTGWQSTPVSGFLPADAFFEMLAARMFPTTTWLRSRDSMEYTPEPDIFHDVFGHVPMHAHPVFANFLESYGKICAGLMDRPDALERMGRLFWFTVESVSSARRDIKSTAVAHLPRRMHSRTGRRLQSQRRNPTLSSTRSSHWRNAAPT